VLSSDLLGAVDNVVNKYSNSNNVMSGTNSEEAIQNNLKIFYNKLEEYGFDLTELKPILECKGDMLILAGAGVGKTTTLVLKIIHDCITGEAMKVVKVPTIDGGFTTVYKPARILMGTFLKSGAEELKAAFLQWCKKLGIKGISVESINFCTLHKEFIDAIKFFGGNVTIADESTLSDIVRSIMKEEGIHQIGSYSRMVTVEEVNDIKGIFTYCRNRLDAEKYNHPLLSDYGLNSVLLEKLLKKYEIRLDALQQLDFEATQELLYKYIQINPAIRQALMNRYDFVFVDEFQDTSQLQYEILKAYFDGASKKIVIGDDDQTIYSWRGSDINIITHKFEEDYHPTLMPLTSNHRCPENILKPVIPSIVLNENRHPKELKSSKSGGTIDILYNVSSNELVKAIKQDLSVYHNIGIISRTNNDLLIPAILLELGCDVDFQTSKSITLNAKMPRSICSAIDLVTKRFSNNFEDVLKNILGRQCYQDISKLCIILSTNPQVSLFTIPKEDLFNSVPDIANFICGLQKAKETNELTAYVYVLEYMIRRTFAKDSVYCTRARVFTTFIKDIVLNSKLTSNMDIYAIDRLLNSELPARIAKRNRPLADPRIKLTTVHDAKGKEWDAVYIWNDVDGVFPSDLARRATELEYEEERRLHYIAWTRAKQHLTICTSTLNPSPFLEECTIPDVVIKKNTDVTTLSSQVMETKEVDLYGKIENYINSFINGGLTLKSDDSVKEDINILLSFITVKEIVDKVCLWAKITSDLNYKTNDFIKQGISTLAQDYIDKYVAVN